MRIVFWGTYDTGKPRPRILLQGLKENGVEVIECHKNIWAGVEDKSQISSLRDRLWLLFVWFFSYPALVYKYLRLPRHDAVIVGYPGQMDVLVIWPFASLRKVPLVWDAFLSLYNTVVEDRHMLRKENPFAKLLFFWEKLACKAADCVILDTDTHGSYFIDTFGISPEKVTSVFVGAEQEKFPPCSESQEKDILKKPDQTDAIKVLFYGQFIPLHGIETIIHAARKAQHLNIDWLIIGKGQEEGNIRRELKEQPIKRLEWIPWVPYQKLADYVHRSNVCLGIFGDTDKAARVIPNKVFQVISAGMPLITRDSPAIRELVSGGANGIALVPPADPGALVQAVCKFSESSGQWSYPLHRDLARKTEPLAVGKKLLAVLENLRDAHHKS